MNQRAQTVHDYMLGIVLVLLAITVSIGLLGNAYEPFFDPVDTEDEVMADALADEVVTVNSTVNDARTVHLEALETTLDDQAKFDRLVDRAGLPGWKDAQVRIEDRNDEEFVAGAGSDIEGEPSARSIRHISAVGVGESDLDCTDGCRIIVEVN